MVRQSILNIKVKREIKSNWKQYLSVIMIAMLAVTLFTGILANYYSFKYRLGTIYEKSNMCDGIIMVKTYDEEIEDYLNSQEIKYQKRIYLPYKYDNNPIYLVTFKKTDQMNCPYEVYVSNTNDEINVLVDENFLKRNDLKIGSIFHLPLALNSDDRPLDLALEISGTMIHPESLENTTYNPSFILIEESYLKNVIFQSLPEGGKYDQKFVNTYLDSVIEKSYNQFLIKSDDQDCMNNIKLAFSDDENILYALETKNLPSNMAIEADVIQAKQLLYIFPVIFYFVALLIILTSISQLIHREQKNIGILKALGYTKWEVLRHYIKIYVVLGLIGSIFGMVLGPLIIPKVMGMKYGILYQLPNMEVQFFRLEYVLSVVLLLGIIILTSIFACFDATNKVPAQSLRGENALKLRLSVLSKLKLFNKIPLSCLMAFRNMKRKISRTIMVIVGVLGCSCLLACGFGIEDTINYGLDLELNTFIPYDISVSYQSNQSFKEELSTIEGINNIDEYAKYSVSIGKNSKVVSSYIYVLPEESKVFKLKYSKDSCLISSKISEKIGCQVGDEISFLYDNTPYNVVVTEIVDFSISQGIFIASNHIYCNSLEFNPTGAWIQTSDKSLNEVIVEKINGLEGIAASISMATMRKKAEDTIGSIKVMTLTIKIFAILLAIVVLYNLALLNFKERTKDIATLKVLGFSKFEIGSSFIIEILCLTFVGSLIGLLFGKQLLIAVLSINENPILSYIYYIQPISYVWTILLTSGTSLAINIIFAFLTNKVQMVESLKSVE